MTETIAVELGDICLSFAGKTVLDGVSFSLRCGELVALVGPGGCGKTQLVKLLATLRVPTRGKLVMFGQELDHNNSIAIASLRRRIGLQFQNFALFDSMTVADNVAFPLRHQKDLAENEILARVDRALMDVGLPGAQDKLPVELSGGMRRRVAIARVIAARPDMAIFDDPVSGLDPVSSAHVMTLIQSFSRSHGCLVVVVSHDLERLFPITTRLLGMIDGRMVYDGPPMQNPESDSDQFRAFVRSAFAGPTSQKPRIAGPGGNP